MGLRLVGMLAATGPTAVCDSGTSLTEWLRQLRDSSETRLQSPGDSGFGSWATVASVAVRQSGQRTGATLLEETTGNGRSTGRLRSALELGVVDSATRQCSRPGGHSVVEVAGAWSQPADAPRGAGRDGGRPGEAADAAGGRGAHRRDAPRPPALGPAHDRPLPRRGRSRAPPSRLDHRCLVRHRLIDPKKRRRKREDYRRWERLKAMELWQMDVMGGVQLSDGRELKLVSGIDDHSRFCISAKLVERATTRPVCEAPLAAMRRHVSLERILTDTARCSRGASGPTAARCSSTASAKSRASVICSPPYSLTTTGKVERFHKTLRSEFLEGRTFASLEAAQAELDAWVAHYNCERPHQGIGMVAPIKRFELAARGQQQVAQQPEAEAVEAKATGEQLPAEGEVVTRRVREGGRISLDGFDYYVGAYLEGETVEVLTRGNGLVDIQHHGPRQPVAERTRPAAQRSAGGATHWPGRARSVDPRAPSAAGAAYTVAKRLSGQQVEVRISRGKVRNSHDGTLLCTHAIRHDRARSGRTPTADLVSTRRRGLRHDYCRD